MIGFRVFSKFEATAIRLLVKTSLSLLSYFNLLAIPTRRCKVVIVDGRPQSLGMLMRDMGE
jgi:hypothetical protein